MFFWMQHPFLIISTHAPRMGSDVCNVIALSPDLKFQSTLPVWGATLPKIFLCPFVTISIHAPRMGSDSCNNCIVLVFARFQSTLPVWGATFPRKIGVYFSDISIHAPRMGSDRPAVLLHPVFW